MALLQFYGVLASTASIFVGILTAYLVTRYSDLKTQRSRIRQRANSVEAEQEVLLARKDFRTEQVEQTEVRWRRESAEDDVDSFIKYDVGSDWDPPATEISVDDAMQGLITHRGLTADDLIQHHAETIRERWDEILEKLRSRGPTMDSAVFLDNDFKYIVEALWDIYDREKYDRHDSVVSEIQGDIDELEDEWELLVEEDKSLDPQQLQDGIKSAAVPIALSVMFPLFVRLLHELGWTYSSPFAWIEPVAVSVVWIVGFLWTLGFLWKRVSNTEELLNESPPSQREGTESTESTEDSDSSDDGSTDTDDTTSQDSGEPEPGNIVRD
ncbi:hypothetical protein [Halococcus saccharolyticus]|uniref:hypothetical protein n=1 Tax=Halococcus saccharolyticus TaxID=62319 RepID=UPI001266EDA4|nr:hypothetical protein [Halococcus saccharolyticus]